MKDAPMTIAEMIAALSGAASIARERAEETGDDRLECAAACVDAVVAALDVMDERR